MKLRFLLHYLYALLFFQFLSSAVSAQNRTITGSVVSKATTQPLAGTTIAVKGTRSAVTTDNEGHFKIEAAPSARTLTISYVGMATQEIGIPASGNVAVVLEETAASKMDEVVVVGYGTQRKSVVTGAISSVRPPTLTTSR